jgi:hypothetical protein
MAASSPEPPQVGFEREEETLELDGEHSPTSSSDHDDAESQSWEPFDEDWADPAAQHASLQDGALGPDEEEGWVRNPNNPAEMSRWTGQPSIMGSSDTMRMILLNFCALGITYVLSCRQPQVAKALTELMPAASPGGSK